jgi:hypothetical protein
LFPSTVENRTSAGVFSPGRWNTLADVRSRGASYTSKYPCAPYHRACTTLSGICSWSKERSSRGNGSPPGPPPHRQCVLIIRDRHTLLRCQRGHRRASRLVQFAPRKRRFPSLLYLFHSVDLPKSSLARTGPRARESPEPSGIVNGASTGCQGRGVEDPPRPILTGHRHLTKYSQRPLEIEPSPLAVAPLAKLSA